MGHNVDLGSFGMVVKCSRCKEPLDLSEIDIDCDLTTHSPMSFELSTQCLNCQKENEFVFDILERKDSD
jgi:hypothetical protein